MADYFREVFGLKQTADGLILANQGIKRAIDAAFEAKGEHEDLRETVHRSEVLVTEQSQHIRTLQQDIRDLRDGRR